MERKKRLTCPIPAPSPTFLAQTCCSSHAVLGSFNRTSCLLLLCLCSRCLCLEHPHHCPALPLREQGGGLVSPLPSGFAYI